MSFAQQFDALVMDQMRNPYFQRDRDKDLHGYSLREDTHRSNLIRDREREARAASERKAAEAAAADRAAMQQAASVFRGGQYTPLFGASADHLMTALEGAEAFGGHKSRRSLNRQANRILSGAGQQELPPSPSDLMRFLGDALPAGGGIAPEASAPVASAPEAPVNWRGDPVSSGAPPSRGWRGDPIIGTVTPDGISEWRGLPPPGRVEPDMVDEWGEGARPAPTQGQPAPFGITPNGVQGAVSDWASQQRFPTQPGVQVPLDATDAQRKSVLELAKFKRMSDNDARDVVSAKNFTDALVSKGILDGHPGPMTSSDVQSLAKHTADFKTRENAANTANQKRAAKEGQFKLQAEYIKDLMANPVEKFKEFVEGGKTPRSLPGFIGRLASSDIRSSQGILPGDDSGGTAGAGGGIDMWEGFHKNMNELGVESVRGILGDDFTMAGKETGLAKVLAKDYWRRAAERGLDPRQGQLLPEDEAGLVAMGASGNRDQIDIAQRVEDELAKLVSR